jgi:hypothetical protein
MYAPFKISVHSSVGEIRYTSYGADITEAATGVVELFKGEFPTGKIFNMVAPFLTVPKVW